MTIDNMKQLDSLRQSVLNVRCYCLSSVSKNVSKGVEPMLALVLAVLAWVANEIGHYLSRNDA